MRGLSLFSGTLAPGMGAPIAKPNDPNSLATGTTQWIQALAHTNVSGTTGPPGTRTERRLWAARPRRPSKAKSHGELTWLLSAFPPADVG